MQLAEHRRCTARQHCGVALPSPGIHSPPAGLPTCLDTNRTSAPRRMEGLGSVGQGAGVQAWGCWPKFLNKLNGSKLWSTTAHHPATIAASHCSLCLLNARSSASSKSFIL